MRGCCAYCGDTLGVVLTLRCQQCAAPPLPAPYWGGGLGRHVWEKGRCRGGWHGGGGRRTRGAFCTPVTVIHNFYLWHVDAPDVYTFGVSYAYVYVPICMCNAQPCTIRMHGIFESQNKILLYQYMPHACVAISLKLKMEAHRHSD